MADGFIQIVREGDGKKVDNEELSVLGNIVYRQRIRLGGAGAADLAPIDGTFGLAVDVTRSTGVSILGIPTVAGAVSVLGTVPVSGAFWQTTQPVSLGSTVLSQITSGSVSVLGTVPVSGSFWQTTQPVSLAETVLSQITSGAVSVIGTVPISSGATLLTQITSASTLQANVSGAVSVNGTVPVSGAFFQGTQPVSGTFFQATQPVSIASTVLASIASAPQTSVVGAVTNSGSGKTLKSAAFSLSASGTVVPLVSSKRIKVFATKCVVSAALSVNFRDGPSTGLEGAMPIALNGGFVETVEPPNFLFATTAGQALELAITGVGTAAGRVSYWDDDAT